MIADRKKVAIVDYGVGNLFSVAQACHVAGLSAQVTCDAEVIADADGIILPGVGAFGFAMQRLRSLSLVNPLRLAAESGTPFMGVCLGFQLMFESSEELGGSEGLGLFKGRVRALAELATAENAYHGIIRVPNVNWLPISPPSRSSSDCWSNTLLENVRPSERMYFVHSFAAEPEDQNDVLAETGVYGLRYCCAVARDTIFGCQFHPEKSGESGLNMYRSFARLVARMSDDPK